MAIDLRFGDTQQVDHFLEAWGRPGPPTITALTPHGRIEQISIGTTIEHELRHFHDFLLSYPGVHNLWAKLQLTMNAMPLILGMIDRDDIDVIPFPLVTWAEMPFDQRSHYLEDILGRGHGQRIWQPALMPAERAKVDIDRFTTGKEDGYEADILHVIRTQLRTLATVRTGIEFEGFSHPLTSRFVFELSAFLVQAASVMATYGVKEFDEFVNRLASDRSIYPNFFSLMIALVHERGSPVFGALPLQIDSQKVRWEILSAISTWCMVGCVDDGDGLYPEGRLVMLLEKALEDFDGVFPRGLDCIGLLDHFDRLFGMTPYKAALTLSQERLAGFLDRAKLRIANAPNAGDLHHQCLRIFDGVLKDRARLIERLDTRMEDYVNIGAYARDLPKWPQCPVHLNFQPAGIVVVRELLEKLGNDPRYNLLADAPEDPDHAVDVMYSSFFPGGSSIPVDDVVLLGSLRAPCDLLLDPDQTSPADEQAVRSFAKAKGKTLIRVM
ncbi:hypothetical protein [Brevundimonas sp.]|uniref:hypothetical protein n=1 Tax=Brevundimonas sp. TaxID=1871086 RepID=UPI002FC788F4